MLFGKKHHKVELICTFAEKIKEESEIFDRLISFVDIPN